MRQNHNFVKVHTQRQKPFFYRIDERTLKTRYFKTISFYQYPIEMQMHACAGQKMISKKMQFCSTRTIQPVDSCDIIELSILR
jgi:hypothetical protein